MESMGLARIGKFLEGMEGLGKIIDVFLNTSETVAFVWGPIKFLLQVSLPMMRMQVPPFGDINLD